MLKQIKLYFLYTFIQKLHAVNDKKQEIVSCKKPGEVFTHFSRQPFQESLGFPSQS